LCIQSDQNVTATPSYPLSYLMPRLHLAVLTTRNDQERICENSFPSFKTQISCLLKLKFLACSMKQAFYPLYKQNIARAWPQQRTFLEAFLSVPSYQTCMYKRGIILSHSISRRRYFCKNIEYFWIFFASWWSKVAWFGQFVVLQINCDIIKLQNYQLWRHLGDVIKLRHLKYVIKMTSQKFSTFESPPP